MTNPIEPQSTILSRLCRGAALLRLFIATRSAAAACLVLLLSLTAFPQSSESILPGPKPPDVHAEWEPWIGEYGTKDVTMTVGEEQGKLFLIEQGKKWSIAEFPLHKRVLVAQTGTMILTVLFGNGTSGEPALIINDLAWSKRRYGLDPSLPSQIAPTHPIADLRREALAAAPPSEKGPFRQPDLVELAPLDPAIHLDIRYATSNDFLGTPVYTQARAFLQRPAAEALLRVLRKLEPLGYGLLIHDAYRPWYVTKIFWDATPAEGKLFVADPAQGSRHNRGCAVDLTLYDLKTGKPVEMPGTYDEMSPRSYPNYPGGTSLQRWNRDLLRRAMESEGFTVYEYEWWHFDYKDWREYPILNIPFENLNVHSK